MPEWARTRYMTPSGDAGDAIRIAMPLVDAIRWKRVNLVDGGSVAALALIDMIKSVDKAAVVTDVHIDAKEGGKSGPWRRPADGRLRDERQS